MERCCGYTSFSPRKYEARHEEQAGAKLHLLHNATDQTIERIDVTDEKTHDSTLFKRQGRGLRTASCCST